MGLLGVGKIINGKPFDFMVAFFSEVEFCMVTLDYDPGFKFVFVELFVAVLIPSDTIMDFFYADGAGFFLVDCVKFY